MTRKFFRNRDSQSMYYFLILILQLPVQNREAKLSTTKKEENETPSVKPRGGQLVSAGRSFTQEETQRKRTTARQDRTAQVTREMINVVDSVTGRLRDKTPLSTIKANCGRDVRT